MLRHVSDFVCQHVLFHVALQSDKRGKRMSDIGTETERSRSSLPRANSIVRQWRIQGSLAMEKLKGFSCAEAAFFSAPLRPGYASDRIRSLHLPVNIHT